MRNTTALLSSLALCALAAPALAQDNVLYVTGNGGSQEELMRAEIFPAFEAETGIQIVYSAGNSAAVLAKLLAQQDNQQVDVAMMNTGPMSQAISLGLCQDLDLSANEANIYDFAKFSSGKAVGFGVVSLGLAYNTEVFAKEGWDAPASWTDMEDPKFAGKLVFQPLNNTNGLLALIKLAEIYGGGLDNLDPGFAVMAEKIAPNVLSFEPASARLQKCSRAAKSIWRCGRPPRSRFWRNRVSRSSWPIPRKAQWSSAMTFAQSPRRSRSRRHKPS